MNNGPSLYFMGLICSISGSVMIGLHTGSLILAGGIFFCLHAIVMGHLK